MFCMTNIRYEIMRLLFSLDVCYYLVMKRSYVYVDICCITYLKITSNMCVMLATMDWPLTYRAYIWFCDLANRFLLLTKDSSPEILNDSKQFYDWTIVFGIYIR